MFRRSLFFVSASLCPVYVSFLSWCVCFQLGCFPSAVPGRYYRYIKCGPFRKDCRALRATNHGSRSKTRESPESVSSCQRGPYHHRRRRSEGLTAPRAEIVGDAGGPPAGVRQAEDALPHADRKLERQHPSTLGRGRRRSGDGQPLESRREAPRRATRPARGDPLQDRRAPVEPQRLRVRLRRGGDLLVPHGPHPSSRSLNDRRFGGGAGMRWLRRVFDQAHAQRQCPVNITWHQESLQTQHLGVGHAFPREGLS